MINDTTFGYGLQHFPVRPGDVSLRICTMSDLHSMGMTTEQIVRDIFQMDRNTLKGLSNWQVGTVDQWVSVIDKSQVGVRVLVVGSGESVKIVGYWHYVALDPIIYTRAKAGMMYEREVVSSVVMSMDVPGHYMVYFAGISVMPGYRGISSSRLLYRSFWSSIYDLRSKRIYIDELCAVAFTEVGVSLCKSARMTYLREHDNCGSVYWILLKPVGLIV